MEPIALLLDRLECEPEMPPRRLRQHKDWVAKQTRTASIGHSVLLQRYRLDLIQGKRSATPSLERLLTLNKVRSLSGVATVTVLTKPYPCPGQCTYCPTEVRAPKSYLLSEPPVMRALASDYDPYEQVTSRLSQLYSTGHLVDKVELIIKGGTWSAYPSDYRTWFVRRCFEAANHFREPARAQDGPLRQAHTQNETARCRIIGLTVETRPDAISPEEIVRLRGWGVTRVEIGVQSLNAAVLSRTRRGHGPQAVRTATRLLRDAGFKIVYHMMPNLPGATPETDLADFRQLFEDPAFRPDTVKLYPCVVVAQSVLYDEWRCGKHQPYDDHTLTELLIAMKRAVPPHVRIERIVRDISAPMVKAGCTQNNLRQIVQQEMRRRGFRCRCVRCREVGKETAGSFELVRREFTAGGGREIVLSFENPQTDRLAALLRLRSCGDRAAAWVRELHTYGIQLPVGSASSEPEAQHKGFGRRLMQEAERIASKEWGLPSLHVIAGVGVRAYYRKLGYVLEGNDMVKPL